MSAIGSLAAQDQINRVTPVKRQYDGDIRSKCDDCKCPIKCWRFSFENSVHQIACKNKLFKSELTTGSNVNDNKRSETSRVASFGDK